MIVVEPFMLRSDGVQLDRAYSDTGHKIIQDETGIEYDEAIDPRDMHRTYHESENMIEVPEEPEAEPEDEAEEA